MGLWIGETIEARDTRFLPVALLGCIRGAGANRRQGAGHFSASIQRFHAAWRNAGYSD